MSFIEVDFVPKLGLPERLFEGTFEISLAHLLLTACHYRDIIETSSNTASALFLLVAGAKAIGGNKIWADRCERNANFLQSDITNLDLENIKSQSFANALLRFISDRAISTNEAGRFSLVKFGIAYALKLEAHQRYTLLDLGSSAGLHLLWDAMTVRYESTPSHEQLRTHELRSDDPSISECEILGAAQMPAFLESWMPPEETLAVDENILHLENVADLDWLSALTPVQNFLRQKRLSWAIEQRKKAPLPFFQADITEHLTTATKRLPDSLPLIIVHTFMTTSWKTWKHKVFAQQLTRLSVQRPFFEISVEFDSNFASVLQVIRWSEGQRRVLLSIPCHPQGAWIQMRSFCLSPVSGTCFENEKV